ncbi:PLP-dependent aminotransferase family protein [Streptomyces sp. RTd22]|uniref:aminotransferase-like domain-containing protein n=1 Tax=Streptomyces sp. RTd22 TaxID=1841249 RepID=UPI0007C54979|nr:PLP-dependent aminotransferase family protein [Streptomyces sp. RTd22]
MALSRRGADTTALGGFGAPPPAGVPGFLPLTSGTPADEALPVKELAEAAAGVLGGPSAAAAFQYSGVEGTPELRAWIGHHEGVPADRVLVTNGALHSLSLVFDALLDPGDLVAVEDPGYPLALRVLGRSHVTYLPVPTGPDGLDIDALAGALEGGARPKVLYTVPDFHNPTGATLPAAARVRLVELAEAYGFTVVADSPYRELRYSGDPVPQLSTDSDRVVRVNSFSKTLGPGLRLGWIVGPPWLLPAVARLRANQDQHSSTFTQTIATALLTTPGLFDRVTADARALYGRRARALHTALATAFPGRIEVRLPEGGLFLWATVADEGLDLHAARARAHALGTDFGVGSHFSPPGGTGSPGRIRLGIGAVAEDDVATAVGRLAEALKPEAAR